VSDTLPRRSALTGTAPGDLVQERRDPWIKRVYGDVAGMELPQQPNRSTLKDGVQALWVAPNEYLLVGEGQEIEINAATSDLGHARTIFRIPAHAAREILTKGCPLDLRKTEFQPGHCAQSVLAAVSILVHYLEDGTHMDIYVARSYGRFIHDWLWDAALWLTLPE